MMPSAYVPAFLVASVAGACISAKPQAESQASEIVQDVDQSCIVMRPDGLNERRSPLDSLTFEVRANAVTICYSRPAARERHMLGGRLGYGKLWRTGANEPTMIHTSIPLAFAGIELQPGTYSIYTVPGETEWQVIVNRAIDQWGAERYYTEEVEAQEVGRATVASGATEEHVEMLTFPAEPSGHGGATLLLEWERTRIAIPVSGL